MPDQFEFEIPPYKGVTLPDGTVVYHDGDEESFVHLREYDGKPAWKLGYTSGEWVVSVIDRTATKPVS